MVQNVCDTAGNEVDDDGNGVHGVFPTQKK
jgi:hypothetical protein